MSSKDIPDMFLKDAGFQRRSKSPASPIFDVTFDPRLKTRNLGELLFEVPVSIEVTEFDEKSARNFEQSMAKAMRSRQPVIPVVIDSFGGDVYALNRMIDVITVAQRRGQRVATIAVGKAMSCGACLLVAGDNGFRYASQEAYIMIHDAYDTIHGKTADIVADAAFLDYMNERLNTLMDAACGKPNGYWKKRIHDASHANIYLTAGQALDEGLIQHIGIPQARVEVSVDIKWGV